MKKIVLFGAGLSSSSLIRYILNHAQSENWRLIVIDRDLNLIHSKTKGHASAEAHVIDALNRTERAPFIEQADLVISMLPARFHAEIVKDCLDHRVHVITPSYVSKEILDMHEEAQHKGVLIMNELGVDPGIDHMSAMKIIDDIKEKGGQLLSFKSFTGGLIAPESDNNPLHYKFTWNPRNVVLAGQGGASCFIQQGEYKYIPYHRLFTRLDSIEVPGYGKFEGYANRDSLKYRSIYGLHDIPTIYRGTLRKPGYCEFWNVLIQLGLTDDSYQIEFSETMSARKLLNTFLPFNLTLSVETKLKNFLIDYNPDIFHLFEFLDFFSPDVVPGIPNASPAQLLQYILERKLGLEPNDKDMLVMHHDFEYSLNDQHYQIVSQMVNIGEDEVYTSMSNTVGLPLAICAKMILKGEIQLTGVQLPLAKQVYEPILAELNELGIKFKETETQLN